MTGNVTAGTGPTGGGLDGNTLTGSCDLFVTKYNSTGAKLWTRQLGTASQRTLGIAVATDSSGNTFVTGLTTGGLDGNTLTGSQDFFVTKYDSSGSKLWTRQSGAAAHHGAGTAVATDSSGDVFVAGWFEPDVYDGTGTAFVTKYDSSGAKLWTAQSAVASQGIYAYGVATDFSGNVFITGYTNGGVDGNKLTGTSDLFLIKYDSSGAKQWTREMGAPSMPTNGSAVATDSSGNVLVTGWTMGGLDGNTLTGTSDFFVAKYNSTGDRLWTRQLGVASQYVNGNAVVTDSSGSVFVVGNTRGGLDGNTLIGKSDIFVTKYNSSGSRLWTMQTGGAGSTASGSGIAIDSSAHVYVAGDTIGAEIDGSPQPGVWDSYLRKY